MFKKEKYNTLIKSNNFHDFLDKILQNVKIDCVDYKLKNGFIAFLEETKVNERFSVISAFGRFVNDDLSFNICASEIDILSIVYMKKDGMFLKTKYIDIVTKNNQDVFLYLEFEEELCKEDQEKFKRIITHIKNIIIDKDWNSNLKNIITKVKSFEPLDKTVLDVLEFSAKENKESLELVEIIQTDAAVVSTLLKVANSALFGFKNKVDDLDNLVSLLGINMTISLVLAHGVENRMKMDFSVYGHDENTFTNLTYNKITFLNLWLSSINIELRNKLMIPVILSNIGKYIISQEIVSMNLKEDFLNDYSDKSISVYDIEKKYCNISSLDVTALLLNYWGISQSIINDIQNHKKLEILNTLFNTRENFSEQSIHDGICKAKQYGFNIEVLENSIEEFRNKI